MIGPRTSWHRLDNQQRSAAVGAVLLIASTVGPFSFVEAAILVVAAGVLALVGARSARYGFHLPLGDGTAICAAGAWCALLTLSRMFARPLGQTLLALACAALVIVAGASERRRRPPDDLPRADRNG